MGSDSPKATVLDYKSIRPPSLHAEVTGLHTFMRTILKSWELQKRKFERKISNSSLETKANQQEFQNRWPPEKTPHLGNESPKSIGLGYKAYTLRADRRIGVRFEIVATALLGPRSSKASGCRIAGVGLRYCQPETTSIWLGFRPWVLFFPCLL